MDTASIIELVGYVGSALVLVSFLMASVVKLRIVNAVGSLIFAVYALLIKSYPSALMNICLVLINLRFLWKLRNKEPNYRIARLAPCETFVSFFLENHREDIAACFPNRAWDPDSLNWACLVFHGDEPAGLLMGEEKEGALDIALDYTTPAFRDASVGRFLLEHLPEEKLTALRYADAEAGHVGYLEKMGYARRDGVYEKRLKG